MRTDSFDFHLPDGRIAQKPLNERDTCRLMVLHKNGDVEHRVFSDLIMYLSEGDLLILNDSKVFPARLTGYKPSGNRLDILLVKEVASGTWEIMSLGGYTGSLAITNNLDVHVEKGKLATFSSKVDLREILWKYGKMPLPPYIKREATDADIDWYQTVYANQEGSIASPTAGLHFTDVLLERIRDMGVKVRYVTLHVGAGTFRPVRADKVTDHEMDSELFEINTSLLNEIEDNKRNGRKVIAVGTTSTRAVEGILSRREHHLTSNGRISGSTDIFIYPGYEFRAINSLVTNFHVPRSTPVLLSSAMAGRENLLNAYKIAIDMQYRFFSYGDAMLIL
jgi:S-adenosylmethionine:tRNA ribosyltransferase-isomerase